MTGTTQVPVRYRVTSNVLNGGSYPPPYRIINESTQATVYASNNPGMASGQGTVIHPGTSLTWIRGGDLYLILGDDTLSTDVGYADITLSYDVGDWQPNPVAVATAALNRQLGTAAINDLLNGDIVVDASQFSSVICQFGPDANPYPNYFRISWYYTLADAQADAGIFWQDQWVFRADPTSGFTPGMTIQVPCRSPYLRFSGQGTLTYALNSRVVTDIRYCDNIDFGDATTHDGVLLYVNGGAIAIGNPSPSYWPDFPYTGDVDIYCRVSAAAACNANLRLLERGLEIRIWPVTALPFTIGGGFHAMTFIRTSLSSEQTQFRVVNNSGGAVALTAHQLVVMAATNSYRGN